MPELPEVETIRRDLARVLLGKKIKRVEVRKIKLVRGDGHEALSRELIGEEIKRVGRRGKMLVLALSPASKFLLMHLKMTGQLIFLDHAKMVAGGHDWPAIDELPSKYSHLIFHFQDNSRLFFNDMRQLGYVHLVSEADWQRISGAYGAEPMSAKFTPAYLREVLKPRRVAVKKVLLDQTAIAGLGNIYVDEVCFYAGIKPARRADKITAVETLKLHRAIVSVLKLAIKYRGTTFNNYRDAHGRRGNFVQRLKVYGRAGEACRRCRTGIIKRTIIGGRGTAYCPMCQS